MPALRSRLALIAAAAAFAALPGCGTDDAVERDTEEVRQDVDREAGGADEDVGDGAKDAGREVETGVEDVDGE